MKSVIAFAALLVPMLALARDEVSHWDTGVTCEPGRYDHRCVEYQAIVELHHIGNDYCGSINETTASHSPGGWFNGHKDGQGLLVRYVDTFQIGADTFGRARIEIHGNRLTWKVILPVYGGRLADERRFHRITTPASSEPAVAATSCAELEHGSSGSDVADIYLTPAPRPASAAQP